MKMLEKDTLKKDTRERLPLEALIELRAHFLSREKGESL
jgi:hypothetical protein